jgi:hypothetical protein
VDSLPNIRFDSFEDLVRYLREWSNAGDTPAHDTTGMMVLLGACLENLSVYGDSEVLAALVEVLDPKQAAFFIKLAAHVNAQQRDSERPQG